MSSETPSWAVNMCDHVPIRTQHPQLLPPPMTISISHGWGTDGCYMPGMKKVRVVHIFARYNQSTNQLWICVMTVINAFDRKITTEWMNFDTFTDSDVAKWDQLAPADHGNECFDRNDDSGSLYVLNRKKTIAAWMKQGF